MKAFNLSPGEWQGLTRFQRLLLHYQRVMEHHYEASAMEKRKKEIEREQNSRKFLCGLPRQAPRRR